MTCFTRGTLIRTPTGERPVEALAAGDLVLTPDGPRPIRWIGRRRLDLGRHAQPDAVQPIRIEAGAFGDELPKRDLHLSPRHCIAANGVIIPAAVLCNGTSVMQVAWAEVEYFRLELEAHSLVWAEGLLAESYMYGGLRSHLHDDFEGGKDDGTAALTLHPTFTSYAPEEDTCLPLAIAGPAVEAVRAKLRAVATRGRAPGRLGSAMRGGVLRLSGWRRA